jgi:hypothetical protein
MSNDDAPTSVIHADHRLDDRALALRLIFNGEFLEAQPGAARASVFKDLDCQTTLSAGIGPIRLFRALSNPAAPRIASDRTKAGLAAAKARGVKLGGPRLPAINEMRQAGAAERARAIAPILSELAGMSARAVAAELNARQVETPTGAPWSAKTVIRARGRLA